LTKGISNVNILTYEMQEKEPAWNGLLGEYGEYKMDG